MASVGEIVTKKYGPLPLWAYAVMGGGVGYIFLRSRKKAATPTGGAAHTGSTPTGAAAGSYGYSGGQLAGSTYPPLDSFMSTLGVSLTRIQDTLSKLTPVPTTPPSAAPPPAAPPSAAPPPAPAPVQGTTPMTWASGHAPGSIWTVLDPSAAGGGYLYLSVPDLYAQGWGPPGSQPSGGAGTLELARYIKQVFGVAATPAEYATWNPSSAGPRNWFATGEKFYYGSPLLGPSH